jgi:hypothetical protein
MGLVYGCAGRLTDKNGGFRPGQFLKYAPFSSAKAFHDVIGGGAKSSWGADSESTRSLSDSESEDEDGSGRKPLKVAKLQAILGLGRIVALYHLLIYFIPDSLSYSVPLFLKRQCDRTLGDPRADHPAPAEGLDVQRQADRAAAAENDPGGGGVSHTMRLDLSGPFSRKRLVFSSQAL